jgi:hypothetical protein
MPSSCDNDNNKCYYCAYDYSFYSLGLPEATSPSDCPPGTMTTISNNSGGINYYTCRKFLGPFPELSQQQVDALYPGDNFTFDQIFGSGPFLVNNYCPMPSNNSGWTQPVGFKGICCGDRCTPTNCTATFNINITPSDGPFTAAEALLAGAATIISAGVLPPGGPLIIPTDTPAAQAAKKAVETAHEAFRLRQGMNGLPVEKLNPGLLQKIFDIFTKNGFGTIMVMPIIPVISLPGGAQGASMGDVKVIAFNSDKTQASIYNISLDIEFTTG